MSTTVELQQARGARRREWGIALLAMLLLTALLMRNWLLGGLPISHRQEVLTELSITWMFREELAQGQLLSGWNPTWFSGFAWRRFLSYPLYYLLAATSHWGGIPLTKVLVAYYFVVMAGSGLAMFGYLRRLLGDWRAALVGAVIYELAPYHAHVGVETWIHAAFWVLLPLPLWSIERSRANESQRISALLWTGMALGLYPVISIEYAILAAPFVALYLAVREWERLRQGERWSKVLFEYALVGVVALGIAAFFVVPALFEVRFVGIYAKHGGATTFSDSLISDYSVTPRLIWYAVARRLHIPASRQGLPGLVNSFWSAAWYPGLIASLLVMLGLPAIRKRFAARAALVGLVLSLLLITGPTFQGNFFVSLPVFGRLSPFRGMLMVVGFGSILAAFGVQSLLRWRFAHWRGHVMALALVLALVADFEASASAFRTTDAYFTPDERAAYTWLSKQPDPGRLLDIVTTPQNQYTRTYSLTLAPMPRYAGYYDNGAPLHTWQQLAWTDLATCLRLHQVRYAMVRNDDEGIAESKSRLKEAGYEVVYESGLVQVLENPKNKDYARLYARTAVDLTGDFYQSFRALPELVWRNIAMVSWDDGEPASASRQDLAPYDYLLSDERGRTVPVVQDDRLITASELGKLDGTEKVDAAIWTEHTRYDRVYLEVYTPVAGVLTIAESWYPYWRVEVDEHPADLLRVNWALLGVALEPGDHRVTFQFTAPWHEHLGYLITLLTLLGLVLWWTGHIARRLSLPQAADLQQLAEGYSRRDGERRD